MSGKPDNALSGSKIQGKYSYSDKLPNKNSQLSSKLRSLIEPLLIGTLQTDFKKAWTFDQFVRESRKITSNIYVNVINVNECNKFEIFQVALQPLEK